MSAKFYRSIWRFNALAIAAVSFLALFVGSYGAFQIARDVFRRPYEAANVAHVPPAGETSPGTGTDAEQRVSTQLQFGRFSEIRGTPYVWAALDAKETYGFRTSYKEASSIRNYVFYDTVSGASRSLLPADTALITEAREIRRDERDDSMPPVAMFFALIEKDSNGDGLLNSDDAMTLALARVDGTGLTRLDAAQGRALGDVTLTGAREMIVMADAGEGPVAHHIDLETFKVMKSVAITR
jgi:hypothetical protein